jgi:site-specific recombinase XerD
MRKSSTPIIKHLPDYLDWIDVEKGLASTTQENYARFLQRFFDWLASNDLAKLKPHELTEDHVWSYRIFLARGAGGGGGLKRSTQQYYLIGLRSLLRFFATRDITSLPADKISLPKDDTGDEVRNLTIKQLKQLFTAPDASTKSGLRDRAILETFFSTGLRISELVALDKKQVQDSLDKDELELSITGKGQKTRTVYFSARALKWLRRYLSDRSDDLEPLFINYRAPRDADRRLSSRSIQKRVKRYAVSVGLPKNTTPHVLRHSFATDLLRKGVDIRILQEFLGHRSITATQIYTHVTDKQLRDIHSQFHGDDLKED